MYSKNELLMNTCDLLSLIYFPNILAFQLFNHTNYTKHPMFIDIKNIDVIACLKKNLERFKFFS